MGAWSKVEPITKENPAPAYVAIPDKDLAKLTADQGRVVYKGNVYLLHQRDGVAGVTLAQHEGPVVVEPEPVADAAPVADA